MVLDKEFLGQLLLEKSLWWCFSLSEAQKGFQASKALSEKIGSEITDYETFLSYLVPESRDQVIYKLDNAGRQIKKGERILIGFKVDDKITWLINELNLTEKRGVPVAYSTCLEVSEMHELEEKLIESHSQLIIDQLQAKEEMAKKETELLQQQYSEQTQFLAMLSHELRSPLMGMNSLISIIKDRYLKQESISDQLKVMRLTIDQLNFLINDILTYSQTEFNRIQLNPTMFRLDEMADYVSHLTKSIASEKGIFVSFSLNSQNNCFYGDLVRISQVLVNLIVNAIKFTEFGGVFVEIKGGDKELELHISDSGEGIDESELGSIFKPFKQLESKGSMQYIGSGLGLAIVKTLVDLMGGVIDVESTKGVGTSFIVKLPTKPGTCAKVAKSASASESLPELPLSNACNFHVLIADDSVINRKVLETFLHQLNCTVDQAKDGTQAWEKFQQGSYDFVFLDIQMPGLNGIQVCQKIRALPDSQKKQLKGIFALTAAHTEAEVELEGIKVDKSIFDEWLEKPASQDKIIHLLECKEHSKNDDAEVPCQQVIKQEESDYFSQTIPEELKHLIPQFIENTVNEIKHLRAEVEAGSEEEIRKILHRLKGNMMLFDLDNMVQIVKKLEQFDNYLDKANVYCLIGQVEKILNGLY